MSARTSLRQVLGALGTEGRLRLGALSLLTFAGALSEFAILAALIRLVRRWLDGAPGLGGSEIILFVAAVVATGVIRLVLLTLTQRLAFDTGHRLIVAIQRRVLARDWPTHVSARASGPIAAIELTERWLYSALLPILQGGAALVLAAGILAGLLWFDTPAALAAAGLLGFLFLAANLLVRPRLNKAGEVFARGYDERVEAVHSHVGSMRELILAGARSAAAERFRRIDRRLADARADLGVAQGLPRILVESIGLAALAGVAWWLAGRPGGLPAAVPMLAALGLGAQRLLPLLQTVSHAFSSFRASGAIQRRIAEMLAVPDLVEGSPPPPLPFAEAIVLEGVRFSYPDSAGLALTDVTLTIRRGERTALTGPNGSGKSTLADLVMGLLSPISGRVLVDGVELEPGTIRAWQRNVAHVPQAPFVSDANFVANIAFMDPDPDLARVGEAARLAGLEEVVASRPGGIESRVGEGGLMLSGGQRQRLALARALYAPAPLLVLDEATSALDLESEDQVLRALDALQERGTTILLIAHSDRMVRSCAKIVRMDQGRITAIVDGEGARDA